MRMDIVKRFWWLVILAVCVCTGIGILYSFSQPNIYEAQSAFIVNPSVEISESRDLLSSVNTLSARSSISTTYCGLLESRTAFNQAVDFIGVSGPAMSGYTVNCSVMPDSNILQLRVRGESAELARDLALVLGATEIDSSIGVQELFDLTLVDQAPAISERVGPQHEINIIVSALIGLFAGILILSLISSLTQPREVVGREPVMVEQPRPFAAD